MTARVAMLRGINLGPNNRIAMPALREALSGAGFERVRTYVQSGNIVLDSELAADDLRDRIHELIDQHFGLDIAVVTRTAAELADVVDANPLPEATADPKRYQVAFLGDPLDPEIVARLAAVVTDDESFAAVGRELYAWHAEGVARSKLWNAVSNWRLGTTVTARNWTTVTTLLQMTTEQP